MYVIPAHVDKVDSAGPSWTCHFKSVMRSHVDSMLLVLGTHGRTSMPHGDAGVEVYGNDLASARLEW